MGSGQTEEASFRLGFLWISNPTMTTGGQGNRDSTVTSDEVIGKVFIALGKGMRQCLICDGVFTREGAAAHAGTVCCPSEGKSETKTGSEYANR
jgi:hypothetical protein